MPTKITLKVFVRGIHGSFENEIYLHFGMFKELSLESRNKQTQNCAPSQGALWPRNES